MCVCVLTPLNGLLIISLFFSSHEPLWYIFLSWPLSQDFFPSNHSRSILQSGFLLCISFWPYHLKGGKNLDMSLTPLRDSLFSFVRWNSLVRNFLRFLSALIFSLLWTLFIWKIPTVDWHVPGIDAHRKCTYLPLSLSAEWFRYSPLPLSELIKELGTSWCSLVPS